MRANQIVRVISDLKMGVIKRITMAFWWSITNDIDISISYGFYSGSLVLDRKPLDPLKDHTCSLKLNVYQWFEELIIIYRLRERGRETLVVGQLNFTWSINQSINQSNLRVFFNSKEPMGLWPSINIITIKKKKPIIINNLFKNLIKT